MFFHKAQEKHQNEIRQKIKQFLVHIKFFPFFFFFYFFPHRHTQTEKLERFLLYPQQNFHKEFKIYTFFCCDEFLIIL